MIPVEIEAVPLGPNTRATYRQYRVRDVIYGLWRRVLVSDAQYLAACRFRDDMELMLGVTDDDAGVKISGGGGYAGVTDAMVEASRRVDGAWAAIGDYPDRLLVRWVICAPGTLEGYEKDVGLRHGSARPQLLAILDRLADFYSGR